MTWTIESLDEPWLRSPHTAAVTLPHRFRIAFSVPVDQGSVNAAIARNVGDAYALETAWREVARIGGAYDVLSVSPDGQRFALRRFAVGQVGGFPPVGPPVGQAFWYDRTTGRPEQVEGASFWLTPHWLPDGSLLFAGTNGLTLVAPDGRQMPLVSERRVVGFSVDGAGEKVAVFLAAPQDQPGDLWLFDLPSGRKREYPGAFTPSYSPNNVPQVAARWSHDGETLAYTQGPGEDRVGLVAFSVRDGSRRVLLEEGGRPVSWAPDSAHLFVHGVGVLSLAGGEVVLPAGGNGAFSPKGDRLFVGDRGLLTVPEWEPVSEWIGHFRYAVWSPDGTHLALWDGTGWLYTESGRLALQVERGPGADDGEAPFWSPDGRYVVLAGQLVDVGHLSHAYLPEGSGRPVGWDAEGHLYIAPGRGFGDAEWWSQQW